MTEMTSLTVRPRDRGEVVAMTRLRIELDLLTPAERRDFANALLRAAWSAALEETRVLLVDLLVVADEMTLWQPECGGR
jgi:hypothetical protein